MAEIFAEHSGTCQSILVRRVAMYDLCSCNARKGLCYHTAQHCFSLACVRDQQLCIMNSYRNKPQAGHGMGKQQTKFWDVHLSLEPRAYSRGGPMSTRKDACGCMGPQPPGSPSRTFQDSSVSASRSGWLVMIRTATSVGQLSKALVTCASM